MSKKNFIVIIGVLGLTVFAYMVWSAKNARKTSDETLSDFKKVNESLTQAKDSLPKEEGLGTIHIDTSYLPDVDLSFRTNKILVRIDTIRSELQPMADKKDEKTFSYNNNARIKALKNDLLAYNSFIKLYYAGNKNIKPGDLFDISDKYDGSKMIPWEEYFFAKANAYHVMTMMAFYKDKVLDLQQKAIQKN
ncbi:MAG: hypothetical protein QM731_06435 [Chitinophagaceae bacterium]